MVVYPDGVWYSGVQLGDVATIMNEHFKGGRVVERLVNHDAAAVRQEIDGNKKKMLAALAANDAAGALPDDFHQAVRGFQASRVLLTAIELDVFTAVGQGAALDAIAVGLGTDRRATEMLLDALVALKVLDKKDGAYSNTPLSDRYLVAGARDDARAALLHTAHLWPRWSTLTECVRQGTSVTYSEMVDRGDAWTTAFIAAMHRNAAARAPLVVKAVGVEGMRRMLDVGGGSGAYSIAFARANPDLRVEVLDLPTVLPIAQGHIDAAGLQGRLTTRPGDLRTDEFGSGFDLILLSAICHMLGPAANQDLLRRCFAALSPGGRVLVQDFLLEPGRTSPLSAVLFALNMLVGTPAGSTYTVAEYRSWLEQVGFVDTKHVALPGPTGLVFGRHP
jgi:2-polyprenyl-3-methyl-5-hydroxy-6-metoxy-1,4-benzoquinol methylase